MAEDAVGEEDWLDAALAVVPERSWVSVDGARIEVLAWGERGAPGVLLAHGYAAHAEWWSFIAPLLAQGRRVVALSLSGMGKSSWRARYSLEIHAEEIESVAVASGLFETNSAPVIVAHSFGGFAATLLVSRNPERWGGLVLVDSRVEDDFHLTRTPGSRRELRLEQSRETLAARFRLLPAQECRNDRIMAHLAATSVRQEENDAGERGWCWSTDPNLFIHFDGHAIAPLLGRVSCLLAVLFGERSYLVTRSIIDITRAAVPPGTPLVAIPDSGHHVMLDQPLALVAALRVLLSIWQHREFRSAAGARN